MTQRYLSTARFAHRVVALHDAVVALAVQLEPATPVDPALVAQVQRLLERARRLLSRHRLRREIVELPAAPATPGALLVPLLRATRALAALFAELEQLSPGRRDRL